MLRPLSGPFGVQGYFDPFFEYLLLPPYNILKSLQCQCCVSLFQYNLSNVVCNYFSICHTVLPYWRNRNSDLENGVFNYQDKKKNKTFPVRIWQHYSTGLCSLRHMIWSCRCDHRSRRVKQSNVDLDYKILNDCSFVVRGQSSSSLWSHHFHC